MQKLKSRGKNYEADFPELFLIEKLVYIYNPDRKGCRVKRNFGQEHKFSGELYNYIEYIYLVLINSSNYI